MSPEKSAGQVMTQADYMREGAHLPAPLRDFHDQKDVFKSLHEWLSPVKDREDRPSWVAGHIYVIDGFLRFMAAHGWTLQRSRARVEFADLDRTIAARRERDAKQFAAMLTQDLAARRSEKAAVEGCAQGADK